MGRWWIGVVLGVISAYAEEQPTPTFGTTVVSSSGFQGRLFAIKPGTEWLPNFSRMHPLGTIYTNVLNVWPQKFDKGFPNVTDRFEWFAIQYTAKLWIEKPGKWRFSLVSDDGGRLKIDNKLVIDNDGIPPATASSSSATLTRGVHELELQYFQGPRMMVALVLNVAPPGEDWKLLNTNDFVPPNDSEQWAKGKISEIKHDIIP